MSAKRRILLYLGHPAHFHNLKIVARKLTEQGCLVLFVAREKDVLFRLLENSPVETVFLPSRKSNSKLGLIGNILQREWRMWKIIRRFKPDVMAGTDLVIAHIGRLTGTPSILINEDDLDQVPHFARLGVRFADLNLAPSVCRVRGYEKNTWVYNSYHELAYLHPDHFVPNPQNLAPYLDPERPFFILRFAQLTAHHDDGKTGITDELAAQLIDMLEPLGDVYITSERPLAKNFEKYRISFPPHLMHDALAAAQLYIGDSQTMAAEAAVLGTPSLRFNDFVGKLSYLEELEHKYQLTFGFTTNYPDQLLIKVVEVLETSDIQKIWEARRSEMLKDKENLAQIWTQLLLEYPRNKHIKGFSPAKPKR